MLVKVTILEKDELNKKLNDLIARNDAVSARWITDEELAAKPDLVAVDVNSAESPFVREALSQQAVLLLKSRNVAHLGAGGLGGAHVRASSGPRKNPNAPAHG